MTAPEYWLRAKRALSRRDPTLAAIIRAHPRIAISSRGEPFATLARAIVGQQISTRAAAAVWQRLCEAVPELAPEAVARLRVQRLRACGLSERKAEYVRDLAGHFVRGRIHVHRWPEMPDEDIIAELVAVRGIGRWTAEMFLMFNLMRPDVLPLGDLGLQRAVSLHYAGGEALSIDEIRSIGAAWAPWRSVATWYLWRSLESKPQDY